MPISADQAEVVAVKVLAALISDEDRLCRLIGLREGTVREAARVPGFLAGVLDYVLSDETLLVECALAIGEQPAVIRQARTALRR